MANVLEMQKQLDALRTRLVTEQAATKHGDEERNGGGGEPPKRPGRVIPFRVIPNEDSPPEEREHLRFGVHVCALKVCGRSSPVPVEREDDKAGQTDAANGAATDAHRPQVVGVENPLLAAALDYAGQGWPVLPLHSIRDGHCTCGKADCDRPAKHPLGRLVPHGVKDATTDEATIRAWWTAAPWASVGIATGGVSGIVALDVDPRSGGNESLDALEHKHGTLPETITSATGGGGEHRLFEHPGSTIGNRVNLAPGLDVRGDGGYIVAPLSLHASGERYAWLLSPDDVPLAGIPLWLLKLVQGDGAADGAPTAHSDGVAAATTVGDLPDDWHERLLTDPILLGYWTKKKELNGDDRSMSAYALAIANRLVREYPDDSDPQRLAILSAFYRAHGKTATVTKLSLTLKKAKAGAPQPTATGSTGAATTAGKAIIVNLADVKPTKVHWLDRDRIPLGTLTILDGDPGVGKTSIALDYAARVSNGRDMPDGKRGDLYDKPAGVVILSAEDDPGVTLRPKLEAMGADLKRIALLEGVRVGTNERMPNLTDLAAIEDTIKRVNAKLAIVDPLMAYLPGTKNAYRDQDMRAVLTPLIKLVGRLGVALLVVRHLNKRTGERADVSALYRGAGSIGIAGAARSVLLVAPDKTDEDDERRLLVRVKGNLSKPPKGLLFRLTSKGGDDPAIVRWEGEVEDTADDLVRPTTEDEEPSKVDEAREWLRAALADGPLLAKQAYSEAGKVGIKPRTLERAKKRLKVRSEAEEGTSPPRWRWVLPDAEPGE